MVKVAIPPDATGVVGCAVTVKSLEPLTTTIGVPVRFRSADPVFKMVKVWSTVPVSMSPLPKSVSSETSGSVSPSAIELPLPCTSISAAGVIPLP